jgi:hypothetical protein
MRLVRATCCLLAALSLSACFTVARPTIAHVHIGHSTDGWIDTPGKVGLVAVAEREAEIAADHARQAFQAGRNSAELKRQAGFVLHAMDPTIEAAGPGMGYGFIRAIDGAIDHVRFAADSSDASKNLKDSILGLESAASRIRQSAKVSGAISQEIRRSNKPEDLVSLAEELRDQSATILKQTQAFRTQLQEVIARENPPYSRIERRYLFGLIRLPNGLWQWHPDVDKASNQGLGTSGYR